MKIIVCLTYLATLSVAFQLPPRPVRRGNVGSPLSIAKNDMSKLDIIQNAQMNIESLSAMLLHRGTELGTEKREELLKTKEHLQKLANENYETLSAEAKILANASAAKVVQEAQTRYNSLLADGKKSEVAVRAMIKDEAETLLKAAEARRIALFTEGKETLNVKAAETQKAMLGALKEGWDKIDNKTKKWLEDHKE
jgi:hypothetical protein